MKRVWLSVLLIGSFAAAADTAQAQPWTHTGLLSASAWTATGTAPGTATSETLTPIRQMRTAGP